MTNLQMTILLELTISEDRTFDIPAIKICTSKEIEN